ncbi:MAG: hypothetical protein OER88_01795 [Planctomycetota bacterium]|nr:hypothetical protein [Planctomycetota bacterium]
MRVFLFCLLVAGALGCTSTEAMLQKVTYGPEFEGDYLAVLERAKIRLGKEFPRGLDPDKTDENGGHFWTIWHNYRDVRYRGTTRRRAHVVVEDMGSGKVRIGVAVVQQINDDIENPSIISEARWVKKSYDTEAAARIERVIAQRYKKVDPSAAWKEKHGGGKSNTLRQDIIDRNKDVDLDSRTELDSKSMPTVTQHEGFWEPKKKKEDK